MVHHPAPASGYVPRRAARRLEESYVGGVCAGLARHLRLPVVWLRLGVVVLSLFGGLGAMLYAGLWLSLPVDRQAYAQTRDAAPGLAAASRQGKRPGDPRAWSDLGPLVAIAAIAAGGVALVGGLLGGSVLLWPLVLGAVGVGVLWRQADEAQRARWLDPGTRRAVLGSGGWASYARVGAGVALLLGAILLFVGRSGDLRLATTAVVAAVVAILGVGLMIGPWLLQLSSDLGEERAERVRSQERADVAAHLHDSVLQTLALIQKSAGDPAQVSRLARAQERDLRSWLFTTPSAAGTTLAEALREAAAEVEDAFGVPVEVVSVGDRALPDDGRALVLAAREAMVNAAKHSGAPQVDVYAEAAPDRAQVFVRDRGKGFDPDTVPDDRHGLRHSVVDRMTRHGGGAEVRSSPGSGTEVRLSLPLEVVR